MLVHFNVLCVLPVCVLHQRVALGPSYHSFVDHKKKEVQQSPFD